MPSLLNTRRPPVFCPGCSHDFVVRALDRAFQDLGLEGHDIVLVSDIGCSGLFDTFFNTHALHGLHGRALTYAAGLKMSRPDLHVVVTMGDGGLGIGGAHLLAACRRNLDLNLLILNNFNFGMTGGQFSATTPPESLVGSGFLNRLERPVDACQVLEAAGAPYLVRCSAYDHDLAAKIAAAIGYRGFSALDIWGGCPGRYMKSNRISPRLIEQALGSLPSHNGPIPANERKEYNELLQEISSDLPEPELPPAMAPVFTPPQPGDHGALILGAAGQRVVTAGELLCLAGMSAGLQVSQNNDVPITVLTGHSVSEVILSPEGIDDPGLSRPSVVLVLADEGVARRRSAFASLDDSCLVLRASPALDLPETRAEIIDLNLEDLGLKRTDWALGTLAALAWRELILTREMLEQAIAVRLPDRIAESSCRVVEMVCQKGW